MKWIILKLITLSALVSCSFRDQLANMGDEGMPTVSVKTYRQLFYSLKTATGVDGDTNNTVKTQLSRGLSSLSADGEAESVSATMLLSITSLVGVYCDQLMRKEVALTSPNRRFYGQVDFTKDQRSFHDSIRRDVAGKLGRYFYQRELSESEMNTVLEAQREAESGRPNSTTETRILAVVPCVVIGSALDGIRN